MNTVLYFSVSGIVYETHAYSKADLAELVEGHELQCLTSTDRQFDFWFSPSASGCQRRVNAIATELLLATTSFTAKNVPLLHGCIVVATHDAQGAIDGLSWQQLDQLAEHNRALTARDERTLARRIAQDKRHEAQRARELQAAFARHAATPTPH
ncbi:hypothetical protein ACXDF8_13785 [Mycolicibacterium sp. CBM1]